MERLVKCPRCGGTGVIMEDQAQAVNEPLEEWTGLSRFDSESKATEIDIQSYDYRPVPDEWVVVYFSDCPICGFEVETGFDNPRGTKADVLDRLEEHVLQVHPDAKELLNEIRGNPSFEGYSESTEYSAQQTAYAHDRMRELNAKAREMYGKSWQALTMEERDQVNNEIEGGVGSSNWIASGGSHDPDLAWFPVFESKATEDEEYDLTSHIRDIHQSSLLDLIRSSGGISARDINIAHGMNDYIKRPQDIEYLQNHTADLLDRLMGQGVIRYDNDKWVVNESKATEGGLGSGRKGHKGWMREITELKTNKHKIPQEHMSASKFLKEMASENSMCGDCMDNFLIKATEEQHVQPEEEEEVQVKCPRCNGTGRINLGLTGDFSCDECNGTGMIDVDLAPKLP